MCLHCCSSASSYDTSPLSLASSIKLTGLCSEGAPPGSYSSAWEAERRRLLISLHPLTPEGVAQVADASTECVDAHALLSVARTLPGRHREMNVAVLE